MVHPLPVTSMAGRQEGETRSLYPSWATSAASTEHSESLLTMQTPLCSAGADEDAAGDAAPCCTCCMLQQPRTQLICTPAR